LLKLRAQRLKRSIKSARKKAYTYAFSGLAPYYVINEFPKSGGTWLSELMARALDLPFRRLGAISFEKAIVHGHFVRPDGLKNVVVMFRDPRDVIVSFYYHSYFVNDWANESLVSYTKRRLPFADYHDLKANLPAFIRMISTDPVTPSFTWPQFAANWVGREDVCSTSYEALRADTAGELSRIIECLTGEIPGGNKIEEAVEHYSLARVKKLSEQSMRSATEVPFIREGSLGGWRAHFTPEAEDALREFGYHEPMLKLGYEI